MALSSRSLRDRQARADRGEQPLALADEVGFLILERPQLARVVQVVVESRRMVRMSSGRISAGS
jgi:hypothetical protein